MRRISVLCALCVLITAGVAWASTTLRASSGSAAHTPPPNHPRSSPRADHPARFLFGDRAVESMGTRDAGFAAASRFSNHVGATVESLTVYVASATRGTTLVAGLYSDEGGHPHSLLASGSLRSPRARAWNTLTVRPTVVAPDRAYWLALLAKGGSLYFRSRRTGHCQGVRSKRSGLGRLPSPWRMGQPRRSCPVSEYASGKLKISGGPSAGTGSVPSVSGSSQTTGTSSAPPPAAPASTAPPTITGSAEQGQSLAAGIGSWSGSPTSYGYVWQDCDSQGTNCTDISGATTSSYTLQASDVGHTIRVVVTAINSSGPGRASSAPTPVVKQAPPTNTASPKISGTATEGQTLSTDNGTWSGNPTAYVYQWQDCDTSGTTCTPIRGATSSSYILQPSDVGQAITVIVTATNISGSSDATSAPTAVVAAARQTGTPPGNTAPPTITGTAEEGRSLTTTIGSWSGRPTSYGYAWQDCDNQGTCTDISGATTSSYTLKGSDVGNTIVVVVTATNSYGSTQASSSPTAVVQPAPPTNTAPPKISGTATEGQTLSTDNGAWSGNPTAYAYQWQDCDGTTCTPISGATSSSYTLQPSDVGHTIAVVVTATNVSGSSDVTSAPTAAVAMAAPANTAPPTVTGSAIQGDVLTTDNGTWSYSPTSYAYQWERCDGSGAGCAAIAGATNSTYTLQDSDVDHTIRSAVTADNQAGSTMATSRPTSVVVAAGPALTVNLPAQAGSCSTRFSSQEVWPGTTTSLPPPGGGYPSVFQRIDASGLDIWRVQAVDGYDDASTTLVSPAPYTSSKGEHLSAWNFNTLDKQLSDGPTSAVRELDTTMPPDALWTGTAPLGGDGSAHGTLADQTYGALAAYEANTVKYFRTGVLQSGGGSSVIYSPTSLTDTTKDFTAYGGGGYAVTATVLDANGFPDWETATVTSVSNGGHTLNLGGWSVAHSNALSSSSTPSAGAAYNLASITPPITSPVSATPWPRPPSVGDVRYFELFNEPDLSNSSYPRVSPSLPPPSPTLTGVNVPGGTLTPGMTYSYRISAANIRGRLSLPGSEVSIVLPSGDNAVQISWTATSNLGLSPFAYRIFGRSPGSEKAMVSVGRDASAGLSWTDTGAVTPSGAMPTADSTAGYQLWRAHEYTRMWNVVAPAMKAVDPAIKLVGPTISNPISLATQDVVTTAVTTGPNDSSWLSDADYVPVLMSGANPPPDAVSIHNYGWYQGTASTEAQQWSGLDSGISDFIKQDQPAVGSTPVFLDETNIDAGNFGSGAAATDLRAETQMGAAWLADSYVQWCAKAPQVTELMQYEVYNGDVAWGMFSDSSFANSTTCVPQPACQNLRASQPNLEYWVMRQLNAWFPAGSAVVPVSGVPSGFAAFAVQSGTNTVALVIVSTQIGTGNGAGVPGQVTVQLTGGTVADTQETTIDGSTDMLNGPTVTDLGPQSTVSLSIGGYGVAMLRFSTS